MNNNANSRFSVAPSVEIDRSRFDRSFPYKTTMNAGELIPLMVDEVLPGDTVTMDLSSLIRMSTPIFPTMDNLYFDVFFFFVPNRLTWTHWKEFMGENTSSYWTPTTEYSVPMTIADTTSGWDKGSIADYMGVPTNVRGLAVNSLWFRSYCLVWNEWFRDQNTMQPCFVDLGDSNTIGLPRAVAQLNAEDTSGIPYADAYKGSMPLPVCRFHDYFSSALPAPQRGAAVEIPLFNDDLPVTTTADEHGLATNILHFNGYVGASDKAFPAVVKGDSLYVGPTQESSATVGAAMIPSNLAVELANVSAGTIIQLRQAFQIQKLLERDARGGGRYRELLHSHFGVTSPDSRMQIPEYLGGKRIPINIDQVLQTSATSEVSPQGNTAAYSLTTDVDSMFTKSFTEHGVLLCVGCIRNMQSYQQGLNRMFTRQRRYEYYWPELANISEQPIYRCEILATAGAGTSHTGANYDVFGYQEPWAEYRYHPPVVTGAFRSNVNGTLDSWHYADYYEGDPEQFVLNAEWMKSPAKGNIDRTLAVQSSLEDQFLCDFFFKAIWTRPMPMFGVPGLADHH